MALVHSPRRTRSQVAAGAAETSAAPEAATAMSESETLRAVLRELEQLREERRQEKDSFRQKEREFGDFVRRKEEDIRRLEEQFRRGASGESLPNHSSVRAGELTGIKIKPDVFDGGVPWREFFAQFELVARANGWSDAAKATVLATNLRGKARSVLEGLEEGFSFEDIRSKLESRFGERELFQSCYAQFTNRKQRGGEDFATLGADIERLARLAYPEGTHEIRERVACAQFIAALSDRFVKRALQMENVTLLRAAVERAKAVKAIQENSFGASRETPYNFKKNGERRSENGTKKEQEQRGDSGRKERECWKCGKKGHFRYECPANLSENKA